MQALSILLRFPPLYVIVPPAMAKKPPKHPIDTRWFLRKIEDSGANISALAPRIRGLNGPLTQSNFYRMIHGERAMSLSEAVQLSAILAEPLDEIARRALGKKG